MAWTERYCSVTGGGAHDGTSEANAWTLTEAIAAYASGQRINVKAGTYANTTTSRDFATAGTQTAPVWWRGYNTAIGDCDSDPTLTRPSITFTTGRFTVSGAFQSFSHLNISGACTSLAQVYGNVTGPVFFDRCQIENTSANPAFRNDNARYALSRCWLKSASGASCVALVNGVTTSFTGCAFEGGGDGVQLFVNHVSIIHCLFDSIANDGIDFGGSSREQIVVVGNTIEGSGGNGIVIGAAPAGQIILANNLIAASGAYGINNSSGSNISSVLRMGNAFWSNTSGNENGFGDTPSLAELAESSDPFTARGAGDLSLVTGAASRASGTPGRYTNRNETSYRDRGALQHLETGGGGGLARIIGG